MNTLTSTLLWMSVQVALFSLVGCGLCLLVRRCGPRTAATCTAVVLGLTLLLAAFALSPWPRWTPNVPSRAAAIPQSANRATDVSRSSNAATIPAVIDAPVTDAVLAVWWNTAMDWLQTANSAAPTQTSANSNWRIWVSILVVTGIGFSLMRLAVGVWAVQRLRSESRPIHDDRLQATAREIAAALGIAAAQTPTGTVRLYERGIARIFAAAVCGDDWLAAAAVAAATRLRSWNDTERRAVLAHELVHVARRDYATGLIARLATAIHFYQPLVLWLNRQLRIQQELDADSQAAILSGDRHTYLTTLAQMALRADEQPLPWAARAFCRARVHSSSVSHGLNERKLQWKNHSAGPPRWILAATMIAITLGVAGIRGPSDATSPVTQAAEPKVEVRRSLSQAQQTVEIAENVKLSTIRINSQMEPVAGPISGVLTVKGQRAH